MTSNNISLAICITPIVLGFLFYIGMNVYVRAKVKKRIRELEQIAAMASPIGFDWPAWQEEMRECREWLYHGWPEPGCIYQGKLPLVNYGFPRVRGKRYIRF